MISSVRDEGSSLHGSIAYVVCVGRRDENNTVESCFRSNVRGKLLFHARKPLGSPNVCIGTSHSRAPPAPQQKQSVLEGGTPITLVAYHIRTWAVLPLTYHPPAWGTPQLQ